jgi:beta-xylosidase
MNAQRPGFICLLMITVLTGLDGRAAEVIYRAPAPLYRDPVTDGAADPVVFWNRAEKCWWMLYTQRRANLEAADVAYCYGNAIGVASTEDQGQTWVYRGTLGLEFEAGHNTFWAPDVAYHQGVYHLFVSYIRGVRNHWGGDAHIAHYTSENGWEWTFEGLLKLSSDSVIDGTVFQMPGGKWRLWYKDQTRGSITMTAESDDLKTWTLKDEPAIGGAAHEGPKVFRFGEWFWMLTDEWAGMRVYRSKDGDTWEKQGRILDGPSNRPEDRPSGAHGDVVVVGEKAYVFYFTHPGRTKHTEAGMDENGVIPYALRRSSIQAAELVIQDGTLVCDREKPFDFRLPDMETEPAAGAAGAVTSGNPLFEGWYADPEAIIYGKTYWIYPTYSDAYEKQTFFDCFSSEDLVTWTKHERILDAERVKWARRAMWAPGVIEKANRYYLFFSANDVHEGEVGGIGVAVSDRPEGKYKDLLGKPLINEIVNGAQPIDQYVFRDDDGTFYMYYGGCGHCNAVRLNKDFTGLVPFEDGQTFKEITPEKYVEGPTMFKKDGQYYFMWSEGGWGGPDYSVAYAIADGPLGPFKRIGKILQQDPQVATGAGHHSVLHVPGTENWYIVYHRRPLSETHPNHRVTCIDRMEFDEQGFIKPVKITVEGVEAQKIP